MVMDGRLITEHTDWEELLAPTDCDAYIVSQKINVFSTPGISWTHRVHHNAVKIAGLFPGKHINGLILMPFVESAVSGQKIEFRIDVYRGEHGPSERVYRASAVIGQHRFSARPYHPGAAGTYQGMTGSATQVYSICNYFLGGKMDGQTDYWGGVTSIGGDISGALALAFDRRGVDFIAFNVATAPTANCFIGCAIAGW